MSVFRSESAVRRIGLDRHADHRGALRRTDVRERARGDVRRRRRRQKRDGTQTTVADEGAGRRARRRVRSHARVLHRQRKSVTVSSSRFRKFRGGNNRRGI